MKFSQIVNEAFVFGCSVNIVVIIDFGSASTQKILHLELNDLPTYKLLSVVIPEY